ncbi:MAG TPA: hypothetical protein VGB53_15545 [Rubricoccaceae bacterium]
MRLVVFASACLLATGVFAACTSPSDAPREAPAPSGPVSGQPDALAARLGPGALAAAFSRLDAVPYEARLVVEELDGSSLPVGRFERTIRHAPGAADATLATRASGTLADTAGLDAARLTVRDPMPSVLPDVPAYLAPATRDQYAVRVGASRGAVRIVDVAHTADTEQAVERVVAAVDTATGAILRMSVARASRSAIYDEATRAEVRLREAAGGVLPVAVETTSIVESPLSEARTFRVVWRITPQAAAQRAR